MISHSFSNLRHSSSYLMPHSALPASSSSLVGAELSGEKKRDGMYLTARVLENNYLANMFNFNKFNYSHVHFDGVLYREKK